MKNKLITLGILVNKDGTKTTRREFNVSRETGKSYILDKVDNPDTFYEKNRIIGKDHLMSPQTSFLNFDFISFYVYCLPEFEKEAFVKLKAVVEEKLDINQKVIIVLKRKWAEFKNV